MAVVRDRPLLTPAAESFFDRVTWDGDLAAAWRPHEDQRSPLRMQPDLRFGKPAVGGISTEILWEHIEAGDDVDDVASAFDLTRDDVRWALSYETAARAP